MPVSEFPNPSATVTLMEQLCVVPEELEGAIQVGFWTPESLNAPLEDRVGQDADQSKICGETPNKLPATTLRFVWPPGATGFGLPAGPVLMVT